MLTLLLRPGKEVVVVGGDATYDTNKADVTAWSAGLGYQGLDYQLGGILTDRGGCTQACILLLGSCRVGQAAASCVTWLICLCWASC